MREIRYLQKSLAAFNAARKARNMRHPDIGLDCSIEAAVPVPEPFLTRRFFPLDSLSVIRVAKPHILLSSQVAHQRDIFRRSLVRRERLRKTKRVTRTIPAQLEILVERIRRDGVVINAIYQFPYRRAITDKHDCIAIIERSVGRPRTALGVVADFNRDFKEMRGSDIARTWNHCRQGIGRCTIQPAFLCYNLSDLSVRS